MIAAVLVIAFSGSTQEVDARLAPTAPASASRGAAGPHLACPSAHKAVRFYARRIAYWREKMGVPKLATHRGSRCPQYLARVLQGKAYAARKAYHRWVAYHWHWWKWLPDKWARIGACETGYGKRPGRWDWNSGTYQGAFGFYYGTWDQYKPKGAPSEAYLATPRQQYQCALNVAAAHGYGAWGCGGA